MSRALWRGRRALQRHPEPVAAAPAPAGRAADLLPLCAAIAVPLLFLHVRYQTVLTLRGASVAASDLAVLVTVSAAAASGVCFGWAPLRAGRGLWLATTALFALLTVSCFWQPTQAVGTHLVSLAKLAEYALLAPAVALLLRRRADLDRFLAVFVVWAAAASGWGLLQFLGVVNEIGGKRPGQREVSFIDHESFGSFTGAAFLVGLTALALGERRRLSWLALGAGGLGVILDGSISAYAGVLAASAAVLALARRSGRLQLRRAAALAAAVALIGGGVLALRGPDIKNYLSLVGITTSSPPPTSGVQTGSQRELLTYIGLRIWEDHPLLGVGFDRSGDRYQPYLAAAHARFPGDPPLAFPSPDHPWGVQDFWVQLLADTGVIGFALGLAAFGAAALLALRARRVDAFLALTAIGWVLVAAGTWTAIGIVAGIPLDALTFLGFGLAACAGAARQTGS